MLIEVDLTGERTGVVPDALPDAADEIAGALGLSQAAVNLKATTSEGLGFVGRQEGMSAQAVVTVSGCKF